MQETVTIGGKQYTLRDPGNLALMKAAKTFIVRDRPNPLVEAAEAIASLPATIDPQRRAAMAEDIRTIAERAMLARNRVGVEDVGFFMQTREGLIFTFWQFCPELATFDDAVPVVEQLLTEAGEARGAAILQAKLDTAAGMVEAKNSSGPGPNESPGNQSPSSNSPESPNSTSTSPPNTDSPPTRPTDSPLSPSPDTSGQ